MSQAGLHAHSTPSLSYLHWKLRNHRCPPTGLLTHQGDWSLLTDQTNLESVPGATALLPLELCLGLGHDFLPPVYQALSYR